MKIWKVIPSSARSAALVSVRKMRVNRALAPLRRSGRMTGGQMIRFRSAWTNEGYSADVDFLMTLFRRLRRGPVLECGTGASTLLASEVGGSHGFKTYCLEQSPEWARYVRRFLRDSRSVEVIDAPLQSFGDYLWYAAPDTLPRHFALVICDGPAIYPEVGEPQYSSWRYGVLRWLRDTGRTYDELLLDDANDPRGPAVMQRWQREFAVEVVSTSSETGELAIISPAIANRNA